MNLYITIQQKILTMDVKVSKSAFLGFLILDILIGLFFGLLPLVNFSFVLEMNEIPYSSQLLIFGVVSGTAILFLTGILAGFYLFVVGILVWLYTGDPTAFIMDSIRGFFTIFFGYHLYRPIRPSSPSYG